ncbi:hypothetical protein BSL78_20304 [Apostichopus japonicus]|uniref:Netrin receptor UNC5 n=1 Tax=Stichopus japonicus TaxID=307972 RepID=A0A2G8K4A1_STIJA|nr:hypothetical protein BSL78_20304 [Apostichopus japonicus]
MRLRRHHPYIEHKINCEGGTISITGVRLTIPDDALPNDHVIAVNVIYDPEIHLPGGAERGRMTPLIKLEPEGLNLHKTASLIIPHSAIIPEPDRHSVIVFFGQKTERETGGEITWTEDKSLCWKLDSEKITLDINILSYVFVNLVSQETEQRHTFRVVPFIDAIVDAKDDVLITVCCCRDIDEEYKLLLEDQQSKLSLGSFATFQISRTFSECGDDMSYVELMMSSEDDSYQVTDESSKVKVDHLCAASRTTHQFRLKKIQDGDTDVVDVKLKVSQDEKNRISFILQSKVKDILLSPESKGMICKDVQPDLQEYQKLIREVSTRMDKQHCENLAMCFNLSPAENEMIIKDAEPGKILLKILDERELIMPDKLIILYEGLKVIHLNKVARLVLEYIDTRRSKEQKYEGETGEIEKGQHEQGMTPGKESKHTRNIKILMEEGYTRLNIQRALRLSHGKLDLGRRVLQLVKHEHERLPLFPGSNLYREQYIDQQGGYMLIAGVILIVPIGALQTGRIVSITVSADSAIQGPISKESLRLTPFVKFGPENLTLQKPVTLIIPHCALALSNWSDLEVYSGALQPDKTLKWSLENVTCSMNAHQLDVKTQKPCLLGLHIPYKPKMKKRLCVIPIMKRVSNLEDYLTISLWFYNDDKLEYDSLINEEVYNQRGIELHKPISILIESWNSSLPVTVASNNLQCTPHPGLKKVDVDMETLWLQNRHEVALLLQNKGIRDDFSLEIESKYGILRKALFQFHIQLKVERLLRNDQIVSPFQQIIPEYIIGSYHQLKQNLSTRLDAEQSIQLANVFQLHRDVVANIGKHRSPGPILLETLTKTSKISPANISALENALTEQGNEECAELIRNFRKENPVVEATMCPKMSI